MNPYTAAALTKAIADYRDQRSPEAYGQSLANVYTMDRQQKAFEQDALYKQQQMDLAKAQRDKLTSEAKRNALLDAQTLKFFQPKETLVEETGPGVGSIAGFMAGMKKEEIPDVVDASNEEKILHQEFPYLKQKDYATVYAGTIGKTPRERMEKLYELNKAKGESAAALEEARRKEEKADKIRANTLHVNTVTGEEYTQDPLTGKKIVVRSAEEVYGVGDENKRTPNNTEEKVSDGEAYPLTDDANADAFGAAASQYWDVKKRQPKPQPKGKALHLDPNQKAPPALPAMDYPEPEMPRIQTPKNMSEYRFLHDAWARNHALLQESKKEQESADKKAATINYYIAVAKDRNLTIGQNASALNHLAPFIADGSLTPAQVRALMEISSGLTRLKATKDKSAQNAPVLKSKVKAHDKAQELQNGIADITAMIEAQKADEAAKGGEAMWKIWNPTRPTARELELKLDSKKRELGQLILRNKFLGEFYEVTFKDSHNPKKLIHAGGTKKGLKPMTGPAIQGGKVPSAAGMPD